MKRENFNHGFPEDIWNAAKQEACAAMVKVAQLRRTIAYSDLVREITNCQLDPQGPQLAHMLGEISTEEYYAGRGLLTVVVVHKTGDQMPGPGFFELAQSLGYKFNDNVAFWINELNNVHDVWSS